MTWKQRGIIAGIAGLALAGAFLGGRYSRPAKIVVTTRTETKTVTQTQYVDRWRDRIVYVQAKARHVETTTVKKPTGEVVITRVEDTKTDTHSTDTASGSASGATQAQTDTVATSKTVTTYSQPRIRLAYTPWIDLAHPLAGLTHGGEVDYRFLGPLQAGVWARTDKTAGLAFAVEF
jgi:hypothetical protein